MYLIVANGEVTVDANAAATSQHELRITIDDTEPTTSSTVVGRTVTYHNPTNGCPTDVKIVGAYIPSADVCLRVAVVSSRPLGTPTCQWVPSSDYPMALEIIDVGPGRTASGTVY